MKTEIIKNPYKDTPHTTSPSKENSFSGKFGHLPSLFNLFSFGQIKKDTTEAVREGWFLKAGKNLLIVLDSSYAVLHILNFATNNFIPIVCGSLVLTYEFFNELSLLLCLYKIKNDLPKQHTDEQIQKQLKPDHKPIKYLPAVSACFHHSFFPKLDALCKSNSQSTEIKKFISEQIDKTLHILAFGFLTISLTAALIFTPVSMVGLGAYITLFVASFMTNTIRGYAGNYYLKCDDVSSNETKMKVKID